MMMEIGTTFWNKIKISESLFEGKTSLDELTLSGDPDKVLTFWLGDKLHLRISSINFSYEDLWAYEDGDETAVRRRVRTAIEDWKKQH